MIRTLAAVMMLALAALAGLIPATAPAGGAVAASAPALAQSAQPSSGPMFIENAGQFDPAARFQVWGGQQIAWLAKDAIWLTAVDRSHDGTLTGTNVKLSFVDANSRPRLEPTGRVDTHVSYFIGKDPVGWRSDVPVWSGVRYADLYPGVALELSGEGSELAWRLAARPGADLTNVRLRVEGADEVAVQDGRIVLKTASGTTSLAPAADFALPLEVHRADGKVEMLWVPAKSPDISARGGAAGRGAGRSAERQPGERQLQHLPGPGRGG